MSLNRVVANGVRCALALPPLSAPAPTHACMRSLSTASTRRRRTSTPSPRSFGKRSRSVRLSPPISRNPANRSSISPTDRHFALVFPAATDSPADSAYALLPAADRHRLERHLRKSSEFFANVICRFVLRDTGILLDKCASSTLSLFPSVRQRLRLAWTTPTYSSLAQMSSAVEHGSRASEVRRQPGTSKTVQALQRRASERLCRGEIPLLASPPVLLSAALAPLAGAPGALAYRLDRERRSPRTVFSGQARLQPTASLLTGEARAHGPLSAHAPSCLRLVTAGPRVIDAYGLPARRSKAGCKDCRCNSPAVDRGRRRRRRRRRASAGAPTWPSLSDRPAPRADCSTPTCSEGDAGPRRGDGESEGRRLLSVVRRGSVDESLSVRRVVRSSFFAFFLSPCSRPRRRPAARRDEERRRQPRLARTVRRLSLPLSPSSPRVPELPS